MYIPLHLFLTGINSPVSLSRRSSLTVPFSHSHRTCPLITHSPPYRLQSLWLLSRSKSLQEQNEKEYNKKEKKKEKKKKTINKIQKNIKNTASLLSLSTNTTIHKLNNTQPSFS
jgi:hypothetical protein